MYVLVTNRNNKKMLDVLGFTCWERDMEGRMWGRARRWRWRWRWRRRWRDEEKERGR